MFTNLSQSPKKYEWDNMSLTFDLISDNSNYSENVNIVTFDSYDMQFFGKKVIIILIVVVLVHFILIHIMCVLYPHGDIQPSAYTTTVFESGNGYKFEIEIVAQWKNKTLNKNESCFLCFHCFLCSFFSVCWFTMYCA